MVMGTGCGMIASLVLFLILGVSPIVPEREIKANRLAGKKDTYKKRMVYTAISD